MKKYKFYLDDEDQRYFFQRCNPLGLRDQYGQYVIFQRNTDCFLEFFNRLYLKFPQGYIDPVIMLVDMFGVRFSDSNAILDIWKGNRLISLKEPYMIEWKQEKQTVEVLKSLIYGMSFFTDCSIETNAVSYALSKFFEIKRDYGREE